MGASGSSHHHGEGQQLAIPQDAVPYPGPQIQYCLVTVQATLSAQVKFLGSNQITTNVEQYYQDIARPYGDGFVMQQFQKIPGVQQAGFASVTIPYQAILQRPVNVSTHERYQLRVEKSHLQTRIHVNWGPTHTISADTTEIQQKIQATAAQCGRLICIETTGFQKQQGGLLSRGLDGISGVDLFFNMPLHPNPARYVYQAINVPIIYKLKQSFPSPRIEMQTDVASHFSAFLNQGWKLVEINFDSSQQMTQTGFTSAQGNQNSIWFFEKEESRFHDNNPVWQGCVVEYMHKIKGGFGGTHAKAGWDEQLNQMGQRGWELACMLETPEMHQSGFASAVLKILMFFQRRILAAPQPGAGAAGYPAMQQPPPSYDAATGPSAPQSEKGPAPAGFMPGGGNQI